MDLTLALLLATGSLPLGLLLYLTWRQAAGPKAQLRRRLAALGVARHTVTPDGEVGAGVQRQLIQGKLKELERQRRRDRRDTLSHLILQSGLPLKMRDVVLSGIAVGGMTTSVLWLTGLALPICLFAGLGSGLLLPRFFLRTVIRRRQARFEAHFADALDVLVRGTRSGLPVGECLRIVANESPDPVGAEFQTLTQGERVGMSLKQSMARSVERMPVAELRFFAIVLQIQQQSGGNLAGVLEKLANVLRARKRLRDRVQALSSEAKASAAIIGALPFFVTAVLALLSPDYIGLLFTDRIGNVMLVVGLLWMGTGVLVMRKMINFGI